MTFYLKSLLLICLCFPMFLQAQEFSSAFRVGLNFAVVNGPSEKNSVGSSLDSYEGATGFHVGGGVNVKFNDYFGVRGEVLFSQSSFKYRYEDDSEASSFLRLQTKSRNPVFATGNRRTLINITNNYINIPISGFVKLWDRVEFYGGGYVAFLVGSRGEGETIFNGQSNSTGTPIDFTVNLDHNYLKDNTTTAEDLENYNDPFMFLADREEVFVPRTLDGYYTYERKDGNFFNTFDAGLVAGVKGFVNQGLFVGVGLTFGLVDITKETYDFNQASLGANNQLIPRDDNDNNFAVQLSVGFSF